MKLVNNEILSDFRKYSFQPLHKLKWNVRLDVIINTDFRVDKHIPRIIKSELND